MAEPQLYGAEPTGEELLRFIRCSRWRHVITSYSIHYTKLYDTNHARTMVSPWFLRFLRNRRKLTMQRSAQVHGAQLDFQPSARNNFV